MLGITDKSYADVHREVIYKALESQIRAQAPGFQVMFNEIVAWTWVGEVFCLLFKPKSLFAPRMRPNQPFVTFLKDFGYRHGVHVELRMANPHGYEKGTPFRQQGPLVTTNLSRDPDIATASGRTKRRSSFSFHTPG
jgi:hypothetical protein